VRALDRIWVDATPLDANLLRAYRAARKRRPPQQDDETGAALTFEKDYVEQSFEQTAKLATASHLWVNAGYVVKNRGRDRPGNQIDLVRGTRTFFGLNGRKVPKNTMLGEVRIKFGSHLSTTNMRFANNLMDRLNLPIPEEAGPASYDDEWLLFARRPDGSFELTVLDAQGLRAARRKSRDDDTIFKMRGGREYGVYTP
jgi:hypothetical protein